MPVDLLPPPAPPSLVRLVATRLRHVAGCRACRDVHLGRQRRLSPVSREG